MGADPFQILGVSPNASEDEIRQAYRRLAKKYHPDLNPGDATAAQKMNEINAAYDAIKNPQAYRQQQAQQQARQQYEQQYQRSGQQQSSYDPFSDPFGFWGYQNGQQNNRQSGQNAGQGNWQTWYTYRSDDDRDNTSDAPGGYQWTYHRTHRRGGGLFTRLIAIYLLIQVIAMLFGSCGYRSTYYDPYYYGNYSYNSSDAYSGQSQTDTTGTGSTVWY